MTSLSRRIRRAIRGVVPPSARARIRRRHRSAAAAPSTACATFADDGDRLLMSVAGVGRLRILRECRDELAVHFENPAYAAEIAAFLRVAPAPGLLFDVGANNGLFSLLFCALGPANRAVAYEPSPRFAVRAGQMARDNGFADRMPVVRTAIADRSGTRRLLLDADSGRVQTMQFEGTVRESWVEADLPATTLDDEAARSWAGVIHLIAEPPRI
jgi:FkbM family methyltransferase